MNILIQLKCFHFHSFQRTNFRYLSTIVQQKLKSSYSFGFGSTPLNSSTVSEVLERSASIAGNDIAFISAHQGISKTYHQFRNEVETLASGFIAHGLQRGDRIAIYSPNCYEWPLTQFAAAKAGLILVNINPAAQANELEYCLSKVGCKALISFDKFKTQDGYKILHTMLPNLPKSDPKKICSANLPNLETVFMISDETKEGTIRFHDILSSGNRDSLAALTKIEKSIQFDDPVNIQFTSGTTGAPKAAVLSHHSIVNNATLCCEGFGYSQMKKITCCHAPLFHTIGCVVASIGSVIYQGTCVFPSPIFEPVASLHSIEKHKCTTILGSPTTYIDLLKHHKELHTDITSVNQVLIGGAAPPEILLKDFNEILNSPTIQIGYGLTETSPCVLLEKNKNSSYGNTAGYLSPLDYMEVKIVDRKGDTVPINTAGEICCRGHAVFLGYWDKEQTAEVVDDARWFHTGDLGVMNEDGDCKIVGRIKDMVNRGGENIYCLEVENFISSHPAVLETFAVGVPDDRLGEEICCWISIKPGMTVTEEEIRNFCQGKISHYKIPRYIMFVEEFPKTLSGKVKKFEMARASKEKLGLQNLYL